MYLKYDTVLAEHFTPSRGNEKHTSPQIQNDLIAAVTIINEIKEAKYYTIPTTWDISCIDQLSFNFRCQ